MCEASRDRCARAECVVNVDWGSFTPGTALAGGLLIGLAAVLLVLAIGRIAGISGIVAGLVRHDDERETHWRLAFVLGLVAAPLLCTLVAPMPAITIEASPVELGVAGLLVGLGTRCAHGCTSGHGVCGLSRRSTRSLAAVVTFMATGMLTVLVTHHLLRP